MFDYTKQERRDAVRELITVLTTITVAIDRGETPLTDECRELMQRCRKARPKRTRKTVKR